MTKRFTTYLTVLLGISLFSFAITRFMPGASKDNVVLQYGQYLKGLAQVDLGRSLASHNSVGSEFFHRWPATLELGLCAFLFALLCGMILGTAAATIQSKWIDTLFTGLSLIGYSTPVFWWGMLLILFFAVGLGWAPVSGRIDIMFDVPPWSGFYLIDSLRSEVLSEYGLSAFRSVLAHLILPTLAMGAIPLAVIAKWTRANVLLVLSKDYVRTARSKGIGKLRVLFVHVLRNALIPVLHSGGLLFASLLIGGDILVETIFSWPGVGRFMIASISARDYPAIQGTILILGVVIATLNMLMDALLYLLVPSFKGAQS